jgi:hypothetical protein
MEEIFQLMFYMGCVLLPLHLLVMHEFHRWKSTEYEHIRRHGVVIRRIDALDDASEVIGSYCGAEIHRTVTFQGMRYEFSGVVPSGDASAVRRDELYLDPGLLYVNCDGS